MGVHHWVWVPDNMDRHTTDKQYEAEVWLLEAQFALHLDDLVGDTGVFDILDHLLATFECDYPTKVT